MVMDEYRVETEITIKAAVYTVAPNAKDAKKSVEEFLWVDLMSHSGMPREAHLITHRVVGEITKVEQ
jgi:hypothetical protein